MRYTSLYTLVTENICNCNAIKMWFDSSSIVTSFKGNLINVHYVWLKFWLGFENAAWSWGRSVEVQFCICAIIYKFVFVIQVHYTSHLNYMYLALFTCTNIQVALYQLLNLGLFCGYLGLSKENKQDEKKYANLYLVRLDADLQF